MNENLDGRTHLLRHRDHDRGSHRPGGIRQSATHCARYHARCATGRNDPTCCGNCLLPRVNLGERCGSDYHRDTGSTTCPDEAAGYPPALGSAFPDVRRTDYYPDAVYLGVAHDVDPDDHLDGRATDSFHADRDVPHDASATHAGHGEASALLDEHLRVMGEPNDENAIRWQHSHAPRAVTRTMRPESA